MSLAITGKLVKALDEKVARVKLKRMENNLLSLILVHNTIQKYVSSFWRG